MRRSRLRNHLKHQSSRNIFLALTGIVVIVILLIIFGMDFLVNFSLFVKKSGDNFKKQELSYIAPPVLNPMPDATKSATITVGGYAQDKQIVKLYVNGELVDKTEVGKDKQFSFSDVSLEKGENEIKAKAETADDKESDYSSSITIIYIDSPPSLEVTSPQDGQTVSKEPLRINGKTDTGIKITINDLWVITEDDGSFSYTLSIHEGENIIKVIATDAAGNQTIKELKVNAN